MDELFSNFIPINLYPNNLDENKIIDPDYLNFSLETLREVM